MTKGLSAPSRLLAAAAGLLVLPSAAHAYSFSSGNWAGRAHFDKQGFIACSMEASYKNGITVIFNVDRDYNWNLWFYQKDWNLQVGKRLSAQLVIDGRNAIPVVLEIRKPNLVRVPLRTSADVVEPMRRGVMMDVRIGNSRMPFKLDGTNNAIVALVGCVKTALQNAPHARPRDDGRIVDRGEPVQGGKDEFQAIEPVEATVAIANMLSQAGISGYRMLSPTEVPVPGFDVVWGLPNGVIGAFRGVRNVPASFVLNDVAPTAIAEDAKHCQGSFVSGKKKDESIVNADVLKVYTACNDGTKSFEIHYSFIRTENGLLLKFAHLTVGTRQTDKLAQVDADFILRANWSEIK
ncbi:MAG: hypothetical protein ACREC6_00200 [Hyphomicrobiaceae bacterium]